MIGSTIASYRILDKLGEGGMGEVFLAEDTRLGRTVAVKILPEAVARDPERRKRFEREARAASALKHPNVTHIYDVGEVEGISFIAMEHVEGEGLDRRLAGGPLATDEILDLATQMADALDDAHAHGIVHRDLKPANLFVTPRGQVKVLDFGLAKLDLPTPEQALLSQAPTQTKTAPGVVMGTVSYMSPEQAMGGEVDARSDLFSLGVVLYQMATGRLPFQGDSSTAIIDRIAHAQPEAIGRFNYDVPQELERIIRKCLEKEPGCRYQSARELLVDLGNLRRDRSSGEAAAGTVAPPAPAAAKRGRLAAWAAAGAAVLALAVGTVLLAPWRGRSAIDSIAVLPFENSTGDSEADYFCDGLSESLIHRLARLPDLRVISRASAFAFRGQRKSPREIGRELGVRALLLGRIVENPGELSISTELVDVANDQQLWGHRFRVRSWGELMGFEEELATTIAQTLRARLSGEEEALLAEPVARDSQAYELYLKGRHFLLGTEREMDKAVEYLTGAVERQPDFALAWATLGRAHINQAYLMTAGRGEVLGQARAAVERALVLDPELSEAHGAAGEVKLYFDWDWAGAERELRRATELGPGNADAWTEYSNYRLCMLDHAGAIAAAERAIALDPMSILPTHHLGIAHLTSGNYEASEAQFRKVLEIHPTWIWGHVKLGVVLSNQGRHGEALAAAARGEELAAGNASPLTRSWLAWIYALAGNRQRAQELLEEVRALRSQRYVDPHAEAAIHAALGHEADAVLSALERAYEERSVHMIYLQLAAGGFYREYAAEPRYRALLRKMGFGGGSVG